MASHLMFSNFGKSIEKDKRRECQKLKLPLKYHEYVLGIIFIQNFPRLLAYFPSLLHIHSHPYTQTQMYMLTVSISFMTGCGEAIILTAIILSDHNSE